MKKDTINTVIMFPAIVERVNSRKDKTLAITLGTNEIPSALMASIMGMNQSFVSVCLKDNDLTMDDLKGLDDLGLDVFDEKKQKTAAQRLRAVLYVLHKQQGIDMDFKEFYRRRMEEFINSVKSNLQPE